MSRQNEQNYLAARALEESELAAAASTKNAKIVHFQLAAEYEARADDCAAELHQDSDERD